MGEVSSAVGAQVSTRGATEACRDLTAPELVGLLAELTAVMWSVPALEHRILNRLVGEIEPLAAHRSAQSTHVRSGSGWRSATAVELGEVPVSTGTTRRAVRAVQVFSRAATAVGVPARLPIRARNL